MFNTTATASAGTPATPVTCNSNVTPAPSAQTSRGWTTVNPPVITAAPNIAVTAINPNRLTARPPIAATVVGTAVEVSVR